ncbi:hypothetical protein T3H00_16395 [Pseudomonas fluorescens]|uniref:hypothetical protein n=1 Tax=Pseudomonas fluorescens TaxID=294 RepID=UPI002ACA6332|nr:hypothetical protein [Pseudomonas fluorescens]MDZ5434237.1 hypothetical protein [Pseudomonas fluorescens]
MTSTTLTKLYFLDKITIAAVSTCLAIFLTLASLKLTLAPSYYSFIVGNITWDAASKFQDLLAAPIFISALLFSAWLFKTNISNIKINRSETEANSLINQLLTWSIPAAITFGSSLVGLSFDIKLFHLSILGITYFAFISIILKNPNSKLTSTTASIALLSIILVSLIPLELTLLLGRLPASIGYSIDIATASKITYKLLAMGSVGLLLLAVYRPNHLEKLAPATLFLGQIASSTLFFCFYPARLITPSGIITKYSTTPLLKLALCFLIILSILDITRRLLTFHKNKMRNLADLISPLAVFALLIVFKAGVTTQPSVSPDDYHFGEHLLGWWQYLQGVVPYIGYVPAHGVIGDDLPGLLAYIFYEGTAADIAEAARLATLILSFLAFISLYKFSKNYVLSFTAILLLGGSSQSTNLSWLYLVPFLCIWLNSALLEKHAKWLSIWLLTVPLAILGVPPQGVLITAASAPLVLYVLWEYRKKNDFRADSYYLIAALSIIIGASIFTPFASMLFGAVRYVLENGSINQVAYGIPWSLSWNGSPRSGFIFEAIRMSWVFVPVLALLTVYNERNNFKKSTQPAVAALVVVTLALLLIPYSMGRIDPGAGSRPSTSGILGWSVLMPLAVWALVECRVKAGWVLLGAILSSTVNVFPPSLNAFISSFAPTILVGSIYHGPNNGFRNIGDGSIQQENLERLTRLKVLMDSKLAPNESYLDLTSRNALYFYLNRPPLLPVTAAYNMVPLAQQRRAIDVLKIAKPRIALLEANNITHDGGGLALRTPLLYRYIIDNYIPKYENGFVLGYLKTEPDSVKNVARIPLLKTKDFTESNSKQPSANSFIVDPEFSKLLKVSQSIKLSDGQSYKISSIHENEIKLLLEDRHPNLDTINNHIEVELSEDLLASYRATLFQKSFGVNDFKKIPIAWGRSLNTLESKLNLSSDLSSTPFTAKDFSVEGDSLKVSGPDPQLIFDVSSLSLAGQDSGVLRFDFSCKNKQQDPRIQLFWWGDTFEGPTEALSVKFNAENGSIVVPLEALPLWLMMKKIVGLRIDLDNSASCTSVKFKHLALYRNSVEPQQ